MSDWIRALKVGDKVVVEGEGGPRVDTVRQKAAKYLFVGEQQFSCKYGTLIENGNRRDFTRIRAYEPGDDQHCEFVHRKRLLCRVLRETEWAGLPLDTLERVHAALSAEEPT